MSRHYVLLDANVPAAHFAPKSTSNKTLASRATALLTAGSADVRLLMPNFAIAEVFAVFEKYRWGRTWNKHVRSSLTASEFRTARQNFAEAIHNGKQVLQVSLDRYHVLSVDLISPVNHAYKINRARGTKTTKTRAANTKPASTYDMLIAAMGIWMANHYGRENFTIVSGDKRLVDVLYRARSAKRGRPIRNHLTERAQELGLHYSADLYPDALDLAHATKTELRSRLPMITWP